MRYVYGTGTYIVEKERRDMEWGQSKTKHIRANPIVHHSLIGNAGQTFVHFKNATSRRYDYNGVPCPMQVTIHKVKLKKVACDIDGLMVKTCKVSQNMTDAAL